MATEEKVKTNIYLYTRQMAALKKISSNTDVPMSALIRRAVDLLLKQFPTK
jgi:hypothetical protein